MKLIQDSRKCAQFLIYVRLSPICFHPHCELFYILQVKILQVVKHTLFCCLFIVLFQQFVLNMISHNGFKHPIFNSGLHVHPFLHRQQSSHYFLIVCCREHYPFGSLYELKHFLQLLVHRVKQFISFIEDNSKILTQHQGIVSEQLPQTACCAYEDMGHTFPVLFEVVLEAESPNSQHGIQGSQSLLSDFVFLCGGFGAGEAIQQGPQRLVYLHRQLASGHQDDTVGLVLEGLVRDQPMEDQAKVGNGFACS